MTALTSAEAQALLPEYTRKDVQDTDELSVKAQYLGYLCAKGDIDKIKRFVLQNRAGELEDIVNHRPKSQQSRTCLHMVMYWNTGAKALEMFNLLVTHGAIFYKDDNNKFPWEIVELSWVTPISLSYLGQRDVEEFQTTMTDLCKKYNI